VQTGVEAGGAFRKTFSLKRQRPPRGGGSGAARRRRA
jgi:hypothetical protein